MHEAKDTPAPFWQSPFFDFDEATRKEREPESCAWCDSTRITHYFKDGRPACGLCWYIDKLSRSK